MSQLNKPSILNSDKTSGRAISIKKNENVSNTFQFTDDLIQAKPKRNTLQKFKLVTLNKSNTKGELTRSSNDREQSDPVTNSNNLFTGALPLMGNYH